MSKFQKMGRDAKQVAGQAIQGANTLGVMGQDCAPMVRVPGGQFFRAPLHRPVYEIEFVAVIAATGPNGEADYTDERYWVKSQLMIQQYDSTGASYPTSAVVLDDSDTSNLTWYTATNLSEVAGHTHNLPVGAGVLVKARMGVMEGITSAAQMISDVFANPFMQYFFESGGSGKNDSFAVTLAQDGGGDGGSTPGTKPTWTYTLKDRDTGTTLKQPDGSDATSLTPEWRGWPWSAAAATKGLAYKLGDGTIVLAIAFEDYGNYCGPA